jgi:hypothetical protein
VIVKKASDLMDPFAGGTEQNIAGMFKQLAGEETCTELLNKVATLEQLTPADFRLAEKQFRFEEKIDPHKFVEVLMQEARLKPATAQPIGFLRTQVA